MIRNALTVPYQLVLRPRFLVYLWMVVELYCWAGTINYLLGALLVPLAWQTYRGFRRIRQAM